MAEIEMTQGHLAPIERTVTMPVGVPKLTLGWEAIAWAVKYLKQPNGPNAGQRWSFIESQARFLLWWYAVNEDGSWVFDHGVRRLSKGSGKSPFAGVTCHIEFNAPVRLADFDPKLPGGCKGRPVGLPWIQVAATSESQTANTMRMVRALAAKGSRLVTEYNLDVGKTQIYRPDGGQLENITSSASAAEGAEITFAVGDEALVLGTVIPTPSGWTTVGEIEVGDRIFGSAGPVTVTHVTEVFEGRPCYRVTFEDGTHLDADEGHLWATRIIGSSAKPKIRTTREMFKDGRKFCVPKMAPFDGPDADLPVDPYVLGAWLGDGSSRWACLTVGAEDLDFMLAEVRRRGVPAAKVVKSGEGRAPTVSLMGNARGDLYTKDGSSVRGGLVRLGVLNDKHVPDVILRASLRQRLDALRGLMDTDGSITPSGSAVFVNSRKRLVDGVVELTRSLGYTTRVVSRVDDRWPSKPTIYKVTFRPDTEMVPFLLPRKAARVLPPSARRWKTIMGIDPIESMPVKCIEVDSEDHLFVAGDGWTLTHNTEHWTPARGGPDLAEVMDRNLAKSGSRMIETCNSWEPGIGTVAETTFETWCAQQEGKTKGRGRILYDARVASQDVDLADEEQLRAALRHVYDDCWWVDLQPLINRIYSPKTPPDVSRRFYLNQPVASADAWISPPEWAGCLRLDRVVDPDEPITLGFDGSRSRSDSVTDATALIGCCVSDGHVFEVGVWEQPSGIAGQGWRVPVVEVEAAVRDAFDRYNVVAMYADPAKWETYVAAWEATYGSRLLVKSSRANPIEWWMTGGRGSLIVRALEQFRSAVVDKEMGHDGSGALTRHILNARRRVSRSGIQIGKEHPDSARKIDAAVSAVLAWQARLDALAAGALDQPEESWVPVRVR